jgi:putative spermidine/putrescine transport system substrate-binding protein
MTASKRAASGHLSRRSVLQSGAGLAGLAVASTIGAPAIAQSRSIKIGSYGGYFEDSFKSHVYPAFTEATGIEVESVTQPNSTDWLVTMQQAASSGAVPADLSLFGRDTMIKASRIGGLLTPIDVAMIPTAANLDPYFLFEGPDGVLGVGAMSWFTSMVINPNVVGPPASWSDFWDSARFEASLGLSKNFNSNLLDIVAATFFDGEPTLSTKDGIVACVEKVAELKPNVALWWSAESQMEQGMKNEDVIGGMYYHDVASLMAAEGFPIASIFPKEGNPQGYGSWCLSSMSDKTEEAQEFITFSCAPETQALMSRKIGTAPLVDQAVTDLTPEEFAAVSGTPAIKPAYESYLDNETFIKDTWEKMLAAT